MNEIRKLIATLKIPPHLAPYVAMAMGGGMEIIKAGQQVLPVVFALKYGKLIPIRVPLRGAEHVEEDKDATAALIDNLRQDCELVIFNSEAWVSHNNIRPARNDPNRGEGLFSSLYLGTRVVVLGNEFERRPDGGIVFKGWEVKGDTADVDKAPAGRFADLNRDYSK